MDDTRYIRSGVLLQSSHLESISICRVGDVSCTNQCEPLQKVDSARNGPGSLVPFCQYVGAYACRVSPSARIRWPSGIAAARTQFDSALSTLNLSVVNDCRVYVSHVNHAIIVHVQARVPESASFARAERRNESIHIVHVNNTVGKACRSGNVSRY